MEKTNRNWGGAAFVAAAFIASGAAYAFLPEQAPAGWDSILFPRDLLEQPARVPRIALALLLPSIAFAILLLLRAFKTQGGEKFTRWVFSRMVRGADTEDFGVHSFEKTYDLITTLLVGGVVLVHFMSLASGFGAGRPIGRIFVFLVGVLFATIGNFIPRVRPNPVMGIRTSKTLNDRGLWTRAHRLLGRMIFGTGVVIALLAITSFEWGLIAALAGLIISLAVVGVYVYSPRAKSTDSLMA
jgi:hypothetical protein